MFSGLPIFGKMASRITYEQSNTIHSRRFVWNFFRLENEHLNNCGEFRAVRDISVMPMDPDDHILLETLMDDETGPPRASSGRLNAKTKQKSRSTIISNPNSTTAV